MKTLNRKNRHSRPEVNGNGHALLPVDAMKQKIRAVLVKRRRSVSSNSPKAVEADKFIHSLEGGMSPVDVLSAMRESTWSALRYDGRLLHPSNGRMTEVRRGSRKKKKPRRQRVRNTPATPVVRWQDIGPEEQQRILEMHRVQKETTEQAAELLRQQELDRWAEDLLNQLDKWDDTVAGDVNDNTDDEEDDVPGEYQRTLDIYYE